MLVLASCLLLTTSALAADYAPYMRSEPLQVAPNYTPPSHPQYPTDDFRAVKPGTNLIFNYEQLRRDQPPQIESRDEDIFRYMYQRHKSTTVPPGPLLSRFNDYAVKIAESSKIQPKARYPEIDTWNHSGTTMPPPPPPPAPKWLDINYHPWAQYYPTQKSSPATEYYPSTTSAPQVSSYDPLPAIQWSDPTKGRDYSGYQVQSTVAPQRVEYPRREEMPSTTMRPHWTEIAAATELSVRQPVSHRRPQNSHYNTANRGSHKFNWTDVAAVEQIQQASTPPPRRNAPPPSIPTLSPWYGDQFGK